MSARAPDAAFAEPPRRPSEYLAGDIVALKYQLLRLLGEGGMGAVWAARNTALDADVAIKLIRRDIATIEASQRLLLEARAAARLGHPSIVRVFDFGQTEVGDPFIVMELLEGESLADILDRRGRLDAMAAVRTLLPVASALAAAHAKGIVHRDMKPDNVVIVTPEGGALVPKVVDFGIAKLRHDEGTRRITHAGDVVGSPDYMSPEQARGLEDIDERCDIWAVAVMLYEAVAGRRPFYSPNYNAQLMSILGDVPVPTTTYAAGDADLWAIIERGLAKNRDDRWQTMRAFGVALARWASERGAEDDVAGNSLRTRWLSDEAAESGPRLAARVDDIALRLSQPVIERRSDPALPSPVDAPAPGPPATQRPAALSTSPASWRAAASASGRRRAIALVGAAAIIAFAATAYFGDQRPTTAASPTATATDPAIGAPPAEGARRLVDRRAAASAERLDAPVASSAAEAAEAPAPPRADAGRRASKGARLTRAAGTAAPSLPVPADPDF